MLILQQKHRNTLFSPALEALTTLSPVKTGQTLRTLLYLRTPDILQLVFGLRLVRQSVSDESVGGISIGNLLLEDVGIGLVTCYMREAVAGWGSHTH
jgi:hypothetical protein